MARNHQAKKQSKRKAVKAKKKIRVRVGKHSTYCDTNAERLKDFKKLLGLMNETLAEFGTIIDTYGIVAIGEAASTIIEVCETIASDRDNSQKEYDRLVKDVNAFKANTTQTAFEMHIGSLTIINDISDCVNHCQKLYENSLMRLNEIDLKQ